MNTNVGYFYVQIIRTLSATKLMLDLYVSRFDNIKQFIGSTDAFYPIFQRYPRLMLFVRETKKYLTKHKGVISTKLQRTLSSKSSKVLKNIDVQLKKIEKGTKILIKSAINDSMNLINFDLLWDHPRNRINAKKILRAGVLSVIKDKNNGEIFCCFEQYKTNSPKKKFFKFKIPNLKLKRKKRVYLLNSVGPLINVE